MPPGQEEEDDPRGRGQPAQPVEGSPGGGAGEGGVTGVEEWRMESRECIG